ncbi:CUB and sushi domain-containing protein 3-like [Dreissena polymorpha]|uniref:CUB and sushi domain-containing protein 3-like n=1 Tax=Dreissena polymorpha TaxID=45954 RepID=UPI002264B85D|nr:CUB and sushi domain-containing protein 3-like [Dreissena polymorpha]
MEGYTVTTTYNVPPFTKWECHSTQKLSTNGYFSLKSTVSAVLFNGGTWYLYLCLKLTAITDATFRYYIRNPTQTASLSYNRVSTENVNSPLAYNSICLEDSSPNLPLASEYGVWIKKGQEVNAKIACPYALLGTYAFDYRNDATGASSSCTGKALDMCTVNTEMRFNYSGCDPNLTALSFSASNTVWCVDNVLYNNFYYVTTFNGNDADATIDNVTTFRFSCFALSTDGSADKVFDSSCGNNTDNIFLTRTSASCPILTAPANGAVTYKTDGATTNAIFTCSSQFSLAGPAFRTCQANFTWSDQNPTCTCIAPSSFANGSVSISSDGTTLSYTCKAGFVLVGNQTRTCTGSNSWSGAPPACNCIDSSPPINGTITRNGTFAYFRCNAGFVMTGSAISECLSNGTGWSSPTPTCNACSVLSNVSGGSYTLSSNGTTTTATYTCSTGYTISGVTSLICQTSAVWSSSTPTCVCNNVTAPANGGIFSQDGKAVTYSCNLNYSISSPALGYRSCNPDGSGWTGSDPTCVLCAPLSPVTNATYTLSTSSNLITQATFSCNVGWSMFGNENTKCQGDGSWSPASSSLDYPSCECSTPTKPANGNVTADGAEVTFTCDSGYSMNGSSSGVCGSNGTGWSIATPACSKP